MGEHTVGVIPENEYVYHFDKDKFNPRSLYVVVAFREGLWKDMPKSRVCYQSERYAQIIRYRKNFRFKPEETKMVVYQVPLEQELTQNIIDYPICEELINRERYEEGNKEGNEKGIWIGGNGETETTEDSVWFPL